MLYPSGLLHTWEESGVGEVRADKDPMSDLRHQTLAPPLQSPLYPLPSGDMVCFFYIKILSQGGNYRP